MAVSRKVRRELQEALAGVCGKRVAVGCYYDGWECYGDNWAPTSCMSGPPEARVCWEGMVEVNLHMVGDDHARVTVWGGDDVGMGSPVLPLETAERLFHRVGHLVTMDDLLSWGFDLL